MIKEKLAARIEQLRAELDNSAGQHNSLAGRLAEAMLTMQMLVECELNPAPCSQDPVEAEVVQ